MLNLFSKIFSSSNDKLIKKMMLHVNASNNLEEDLSQKPDSYFKDLKQELNKKILPLSNFRYHQKEVSHMKWGHSQNFQTQQHHKHLDLQ